MSYPHLKEISDLAMLHKLCTEAANCKTDSVNERINHVVANCNFLEFALVDAKLTTIYNIYGPCRCITNIYGTIYSATNSFIDGYEVKYYREYDRMRSEYPTKTSLYVIKKYYDHYNNIFKAHGLDYGNTEIDDVFENINIDDYVPESLKHISDGTNYKLCNDYNKSRIKTMYAWFKNIFHKST